MAKYQSVNGAWPEGTNDGRALKPTAQEAVTACKKLYRFAMGHPFRGPVKITSGNRRTWIRHGVLYVNPDERGTGGWHEIVHSMSHWCTYRLVPTAKNHGHQHAFMEREMINLVVSKGWLEGKLRRPEKEKPDVDVRAEKIANAEQRLARWQTKLKRAQNAIKKLERRLRRLQK